MPGCRISLDWSYKGFKTIILENEKIRASILVDYGAKIFELIDKVSDRDFLYHNPRVECRTPVYGANVDNWWCGGIDEAIPTGHPCRYKGEDYPYLGELWSLPWNYNLERNDHEEVKLHLWRTTIIAPLKVERWISISKGESMLRMHHKITNLSYSDCEFIWGIHPSYHIEPGYRIELPKCKVIIHESLPNERLGKRGTIYEWPYAVDKSGRTVDMRVIPPPTTLSSDLHYAIEFSDGWYALLDPKGKSGIGMTFPKDIFRAIWLWLVYGGWRGVYCVALEPWTGYPARLDEAVKNGVYSKLRPKDSLECDTRIVIFHGIGEVKKITFNGEVVGR